MCDCVWVRASPRTLCLHSSHHGSAHRHPPLSANPGGVCIASSCEPASDIGERRESPRLRALAQSEACCRAIEREHAHVAQPHRAQLGPNARFAIDQLNSQHTGQLKNRHTKQCLSRGLSSIWSSSKRQWPLRALSRAVHPDSTGVARAARLLTTCMHGAVSEVHEHGSSRVRNPCNIFTHRRELRAHQSLDLLSCVRPPDLLHPRARHWSGISGAAHLPPLLEVQRSGSARKRRPRSACVCVLSLSPHPPANLPPASSRKIDES
jgi:hypothetical protein